MQASHSITLSPEGVSPKRSILRDPDRGLQASYDLALEVPNYPVRKITKAPEVQEQGN